MTTQDLLRAVARYRKAKAAMKEATSVPSIGAWSPSRPAVARAMEEYRISRKGLEYVIDRLEIPASEESDG
jgi:hypothetical protein